MPEKVLTGANMKVTRDTTANLRSFVEPVDSCALRPVFDIGFATGASQVCFDLPFKPARVFALQSATVLLMSTAWLMRGHDRGNKYRGGSTDLAVRANAFFNQSWLLVSNQCHIKEGVRHWCYNQIVDPFGTVVSGFDEEGGVISHAADLAEEVLRAWTAAFVGLNLLQDRRPEHSEPVSDRRQYRGER